MLHRWSIAGCDRCNKRWPSMDESCFAVLHLLRRCFRWTGDGHRWNIDESDGPSMEQRNRPLAVDGTTIPLVPSMDHRRFIVGNRRSLAEDGTSMFHRLFLTIIVGQRWPPMDHRRSIAVSQTIAGFSMEFLKISQIEKSCR